MEKFIHGILKDEGASFVEISDVELTFKKELEVPPASRTQKSTVSIVFMTIGPFKKDDAEGIKDVVKSQSFFERFVQENTNPLLVLEGISNTSK